MVVEDSQLDLIGLIIPIKKKKKSPCTRNEDEDSTEGS